MRRRYGQKCFAIPQFRTAADRQPLHLSGTKSRDNIVDALAIMYLMAACRRVVANVSNIPHMAAIIRGTATCLTTLTATSARPAAAPARATFAAPAPGSPPMNPAASLPSPVPVPPKAEPADFPGRFREIISDPLNLLIERHPLAGTVQDGKVVLHTGIRVPVAGDGAYYGDFSQILLLNRGVHEPLEEFVFQCLVPRLPAAPTMIELGSYWAHYSMWLKRKRPAARCILVDSEAHNLEVGRANFRDNGFEGEFHRAAIGSERSVEAFFDFSGGARLDVLHADIQGWEGEMLKGLKAPLAGHQIDYLFVSTHGQPVHQYVVGALREAGYRVEVSADFEHETTSFDGLVFASSPAQAPVLPGFQAVGREELVRRSPHSLLNYLSVTLHAADRAAVAPAPSGA